MLMTWCPRIIKQYLKVFLKTSNTPKTGNSWVHQEIFRPKPAQDAPPSRNGTSKSPLKGAEPRSIDVGLFGVLWPLALFAIYLNRFRCLRYVRDPAIEHIYNRTPPKQTGSPCFLGFFFFPSPCGTPALLHSLRSPPEGDPIAHRRERLPGGHSGSGGKGRRGGAAADTGWRRR